MNDWSSPSAQTRRPAARMGISRSAAILALAVVLLLGASGIAARLHNRAELARRAEENATPVVAVVSVKAAPPTQELVLPGTVEAYVDAPIYARTNGYLKRWLVDIGAQVKAGDLLAEIDTPEVDQQLRQAEADLVQAEANEKLARSTAERYRKLLVTDSVSRQDADDRRGDWEAKQALLKAAQANVQRLRDTQAFQRIVAPFDGTITTRRVDVGQLVSNGAGNELFHIADLRKLRIYVQVPQNYAPSARPGVAAEVRFAERPTQPYSATIVHTADALDPAARSLLTELQVDNANGELFPGAYAEVHFKLPGPAGTIRVPANALLFRAEGPQVATLQGEDRVALKSVVLGRDFGTELEVLSGVAPQERVIVNPPDSIFDGARVRIAQMQKPQSKPEAGAQRGEPNSGEPTGQTGGTLGETPDQSTQGNLKGGSPQGGKPADPGQQKP